MRTIQLLRYSYKILCLYLHIPKESSSIRLIGVKMANEKLTKNYGYFPAETETNGLPRLRVVVRSSSEKGSRAGDVARLAAILIKDLGLFEPPIIATEDDIQVSTYGSTQVSLVQIGTEVYGVPDDYQQSEGYALAGANDDTDALKARFRDTTSVLLTDEV